VETLVEAHPVTTTRAKRHEIILLRDVIANLSGKGVGVEEPMTRHHARTQRPGQPDALLTSGIHHLVGYLAVWYTGWYHVEPTAYT